MNAAYNYAVVYKLTATIKTPLRSGDAEGSTEALLHTADGALLLQGTSIAGALREWFHNNNAAMEKCLFGDQTEAGELIVSDGLFRKDAVQEIRPRVRIDGKTGTAADGGKYDIAHIATGAKFDFTLTVLSATDTAEEQAAVEQALAAAESGEIRFGAQKTNGFGAVSLQGEKQAYNLKKEKSRNDWLEGRGGFSVKLTLQKPKKPSVVRFQIEGEMPNVLVKASGRELRDSRSITVNIRENGKPVIPGSSVKGAVRGRATAIAERLGKPETAEYAFGFAGDGDCDGQAGKLTFTDVVLDEARPREITRIRIDKFTAGVQDHALFTEEPLGCRIRTEILAPQEENVCGLLMLALRDLGFGMYGFGSGASIGRGVPEKLKISAQTPGCKPVELSFDAQRRCTVKDPDKVLDKWMASLGGAEK